MSNRQNGVVKSPWTWIPSLYFAEGLPYIALMVVSAIMYKTLGISKQGICLLYSLALPPMGYKTSMESLC